MARLNGRWYGPDEAYQDLDNTPHGFDSFDINTTLAEAVELSIKNSHISTFYEIDIAKEIGVDHYDSPGQPYWRLNWSSSARFLVGTIEPIFQDVYDDTRRVVNGSNSTSEIQRRVGYSI